MALRELVEGSADLDVAIKWRHLTFTAAANWDH